MCKSTILLVYHVILTLYVIFLETIFWKSWSVDCIRQINVWLAMYCLSELLITISLVLTIIFWGCANDPTMAETRLKVYFQVWIYIFNIGWVIYGSSFIYTDKIN